MINITVKITNAANDLFIVYSQGDIHVYSKTEILTYFRNMSWPSMPCLQSMPNMFETKYIGIYNAKQDLGPKLLKNGFMPKDMIQEDLDPLLNTVVSGTQLGVIEHNPWILILTKLVRYYPHIRPVILPSLLFIIGGSIINLSDFLSFFSTRLNNMGGRYNIYLTNIREFFLNTYIIRSRVTRVFTMHINNLIRVTNDIRNQRSNIRTRGNWFNYDMVTRTVENMRHNRNGGFLRNLHRMYAYGASPIRMLRGRFATFCTTPNRVDLPRIRWLVHYNVEILQSFVTGHAETIRQRVDWLRDSYDELRSSYRRLRRLNNVNSQYYLALHDHMSRIFTHMVNHMLFIWQFINIIIQEIRNRLP